MAMILVVHKSPIVAAGVQRIAREHDVDQVTSLQGAQDYLAEHRPSLILVATALPDGNGIDLVQGYARTCIGTRWMLVSDFDDALTRTEASEAGMAGLIALSCTPDQWLDAIEAALGGQAYPFDFGTRPAMLGCNALDRLSQREQAVFELIADGKTLPEIAARLGRAEKTVKTTRDRIRVKLNIDNSVLLDRYATHWRSRQDFQARVHN